MPDLRRIENEADGTDPSASFGFLVHTGVSSRRVLHHSLYCQEKIDAGTHHQPSQHGIEQAGTWPPHVADDELAVVRGEEPVPVAESCQQREQAHSYKDGLNDVMHFHKAGIACVGLLQRLEIQTAAAVFRFTDFDLDRIARQQFFDQFGPFDETQGTAVEVVLVAHVVHFFQLLDAVEVEVVNQFAGFVRTVFIHDGKGG